MSFHQITALSLHVAGCRDIYKQSKVHEELVADYTAEYAGTKDGYDQLPTFSNSA